MNRLEDLITELGVSIEEFRGLLIDINPNWRWKEFSESTVFGLDQIKRIKMQAQRSGLWNPNHPIINGKELAAESDLSETDLKGVELTGLDLSGADLSGADLSGAKLIDVNLANTNLTNTCFKDADLYSCQIWGADLWGSDLSGSRINTCNLQGSNLDLTNLNQAIFEGTNARSASFDKANLSGVVFTWNSPDESVASTISDPLSSKYRIKTNLEYSSFIHAKLQRAKFHWATIDFADFRYADLNHADFTHTRSTGARFQYANLQHADFSLSQFWGESGEVGSLTFSHQGTNFSGADLSNSVITFSGAFNHCNLSRADLTGTEFRSSGDTINLRGAKLPNGEQRK